MKSALLLVTVIAAPFAQAQGRPEFEVASIKPALPPTPAFALAGKFVGTRVNGARAEFGSTPLNSLIAQAFRVKLFQVEGPDWMGQARFDIQAKLPTGSSTDQVPQMLQSLLEDRFGLKFHRATQEFSVYALAVAKNGPRLTPVPEGYDPARTNNRRPFTLDVFAWWIYQAVDRPVLDETGLAGEYIFDMTEIMHDVVGKALPRANTMSPEAAAEPTGGGTLRALQPLGLGLEPCKRMLPIIVVDKIERVPVEN
jgi:uncharacterized protein (TIGR03435 family)